MFLKQLQVGHMAIFAYIVGDKETGDALVIDPAAETERIVAEAQKNNLTIRYIVNTHGHVDHISGNADMKKKTGAKIVIHEADADMLTSTPAMILSMFRAKASPAADILVREGDSIQVGSVNAEGPPHARPHARRDCALHRRLRVHGGHSLRRGRRADRPARGVLGHDGEGHQGEALHAARRDGRPARPQLRQDAHLDHQERKAQQSLRPLNKEPRP